MPLTDARDVEQVLDELRLRLRVALDGLEAARRACSASSPSRAQHRGPSEDRVERRAELVRERREELVLQPVGLLGLPARVLLGVERRLQFRRPGPHADLEAGVGVLQRGGVTLHDEVRRGEQRQRADDDDDASERVRPVAS